MAAGCRMWLRWAVACLAVVSVALGMGVLAWVGNASANSGTKIRSERVVVQPSGDCWGGALVGEPVACYVLEQAEADGALEVVGVFLAPSGPLHVMLNRADAVDEDLLGVLHAKFKEFVLSPQGVEIYGLEAGCTDFDSHAACVDAWMGDGPWYISVQFPFSIFSRATSTHDDVLLIPGGLNGREQVPGWASWEQLWPVPTVSDSDSIGQTASEESLTGGRFDVSDVDVITGLGEEDCEGHELPVTDRDCRIWRTYGHLGFVASSGTRDYLGEMVPNRYFQIKSPPVEASARERVVLELLDDYDDARYQAGELNIVLIPVKYDLGELWRWAVILDRFKYSKSNTIGLMGAWVDTNGAPINRPEDIRLTINARGLDPAAVAEALPELLPELGIPEDAVGRVRHYDTDLRRYRDEWQSLDSAASEDFEDIVLLAVDDFAPDGLIADETSVMADSMIPEASDGTSEDAAAQPGADATPDVHSETSADAAGNGTPPVNGNFPEDDDSRQAPESPAVEPDEQADTSAPTEEEATPQSSSASPETAQSGPPGAAADDGGGLMWWLAAVLAAVIVGMVAVGVRRARRA